MDIVLIIAITSIIAILLILVSLLKPKFASGNANESEGEAAPVRQPVARRRDPDRPAARARRNVQSRLRTPAAVRRENEDDDDDDDEDDLPYEEEEEPLPFGIADAKIGAKKRKKLEMKAEKKAQREYDEQEREERRERQKLLDEQRKKEEDRQKQEEAKLEEEERLRKEELARKEHEEYLKMKELFSVEEQGFEEAETEQESQDLLQEFINYIKSSKVVLMEDVASQFKLKTQEAIDRIQTLQGSGQLTGVIDDRGKFIYISKEELEAVAKFIKQRGRVSISELVESSNTLINLSPCST